MTNNDVEVMVNGKPVRKYFFEGNWWILAKKGATYQLKVKNTSSRRVMVSASVDGIDTISGKCANSDSGGYILNSYGSFLIKGWRVSDDEVNAFQFANKEQSYAVTSPEGEQSSVDCGVIAIRVRKEKNKQPILIKDWKYRTPPIFPKNYPQFPEPPPWFPGVPFVPQNPVWKDNTYTVTCGQGNLMRSAAPLNNQVSCMSLSLDLGTKFSDEVVEDKVQTVEFEPEDHFEEINIYYASAARLREIGVPIDPPKPSVVLPKGFKDSGFCKPPKK